MCIAKDEDQYIEEWLDYNHKLGFDEIVMYVNDWDCKVSRPYLKKVEFNGPHKQMEAYNHFIDNNKTKYTWVAFFDCDEFLVLKKHKTINEFLDEYDNPVGISVNWVFFGADGLVHRGEHENSLLSNFFKRQRDSDQHVKTILKLSSNGKMVLPHNPNTWLMDTNRKLTRGPYNPNGPIDVVQLNHYHHKTYEDWLVRCNRGQADNGPTKTPEQWKKTQFDFCEIEDYDAYNFMYKN